MMAHVPASVGADFDEIAEANPGWKVEREPDGGFTMSPTGSVSGAHDAALMKLLLAWNETAGGILFGSSAGFTMPDASMRSPDAAWMPMERWRALPKAERFIAVVPDVCIEVVSVSDNVGYLIAKLQRYRAYGATFVVLVDPFRRRSWTDGTPPEGFPTDFTSVFDAGA